ncbi:tetratricopeptide repeat protein [bacterium]|nr:tetratricopeptide repeat protein [bacterium]
MENRTATVIRSPERDSRISLRHAMPRRFNMVMAALAVFAATYFSCPPARCQEPSSKESSNTAAAESKPRAYSAEAIKHYNKGLEFHQSGFFEKAVSEYKLAIASDDRLEQAYSNLGLIYISQKSFALAQDAFDKALFLKPNRPTSLNGLASVLFARGQVEQAIEKWQKAVSVDPKFASAYFNMGTAFESQKKYDEALAVYVKAVTIAPDMADAFYHMGTLLNKQKHPAQALVLLRKAVDLAAESEFARDARKQIVSIENQFAKDGSKDSGKDNKTKVVSDLPPTRRQSPSVGASRQEIIDSAARAVEKKRLEKELKAAEALKAKENPSERQGGLLGLVKRKPKSEMKMFVHPPQATNEQKSE